MMKVELNHCSVIELERNCTLKVTSNLGIEIVAVRGTVWITETASREDRFLGAGQSLVIGPGNQAYVTAFDPAAVRVIQQSELARSSWAGWFLEKWAGWFDMAASRRHAERLWGVI